MEQVHPVCVSEQKFCSAFFHFPKMETGTDEDLVNFTHISTNVSYLYTFSVSCCWMSYYKTQQYSLGQPLSLQPLSATMQHKITAWVKPLSLHVNKITTWVQSLSLHVNRITAWVQPLSLHVNYELDWLTAMLVVCVCHGFLSINCLSWHQNFQQSDWLNTVSAIHVHVLPMQE